MEPKCVSNGTAKSPMEEALTVDKTMSTESVKSLGTKNPSTDILLGLPRHPLLNCGTANAQHVYVRRKAEADLPKSGTVERVEMIVDSNKIERFEDTRQPTNRMMESKADAVIVSREQPHILVPPADSIMADLERMKDMHWEERYHYMLILLGKLDELNQDDYIQKLCSYSSVELSNVAVQLETRSIQLSLKEAMEMQRVAALNVLGNHRVDRK